MSLPKQRFGTTRIVQSVMDVEIISNPSQNNEVEENIREEVKKDIKVDK